MYSSNWCFWTVALEKTLGSPLDCKEIQPVHPKGNQLWIFIGRTDAEAETPILWPPDEKNWLIWKDPDAGKAWRWEEKGTTRRWDGWMASPTQWTWVWVNSREAWSAAVYGVTKSRTWLSGWIELNWTHIIIGLPWSFSGKKSTCQCRRHGFKPWVRKIPWRRKWQPTPVFLARESHGKISLVGYSPWGHKKSQTWLND